MNTSIADELEADLAGLSDDDGGDLAYLGLRDDEEEPGDDDDYTNDTKDATQNSRDEGPPPKRLKASSVDDVYQFVNDLDPIIREIEDFESKPFNRQGAVIDAGNFEDDPEYKLVDKTNTFSISINDHMLTISNFLRDAFSPRFPELNTLLPDAGEYAKTVAVFGDKPIKDGPKYLEEPSETLDGKALSDYILRPKLMTIAVESATSKGDDLTPGTYARIKNACSAYMKLEKARLMMAKYVSSRIAYFAPNVTEILGPDTAAKIINGRGGIKKLSLTPGGNLSVVGWVSEVAGLATNTGVRSKGYLFHSSIVQNAPIKIRGKIQGIVAAKVVLAARLDACGSSRDGEYGFRMVKEIEKQIDRLSKPAPNEGSKALPAPKEKPSRKRGGRHARLQKAANGVTKIRSDQNKVTFNQEGQNDGYDVDEDDIGRGASVGNNDGRIRAAAIDDSTRAKMRKKTVGWGDNAGGGVSSSLGAFAGAGGGATAMRQAGLRTSGAATGFGTATNLNFSSREGLEMVDPSAVAAAERKKKTDEAKYFGSGTFTNLGNSGAGSGEFKVPALPMKRAHEAMRR